MAAMAPRRIGEILSAAFQLYRRHWRTLMVIAAVVVVPLTLLQYGIGHWFRTNGQQLQDPAEVSTSLWAVAGASLLAALVGPLLYQVLTGAITWNIAAEVAGQDLDAEQSYRFGFARLGPPGRQHPGRAGYPPWADRVHHPLDLHRRAAGGQHPGPGHRGQGTQACCAPLLGPGRSAPPVARRLHPARRRPTRW